MLKSVETVESVNTLVKNNIPFLFIISFDLENNMVVPLDELEKHRIFCSIPGFSNIPHQQQPPVLEKFEKSPVSFEEYRHLFNQVSEEIHRGNSFLLNLTLPTPVYSNLSLYDIFYIAKARYKLYAGDCFALFSPESFITIEDGVLRTFPMKGTIRADVPNALDLIMNDSKEAAEHATIVDLLRNDLSMVASQVQVTRFRYGELVETNFGPIYQISSEIEGKLPQGYKNHLGEILFSLLPAGSVTGAPKKKTIEIINQVEVCPRGYYTGVFGVWDTKKLDSAVMIRYIRNQEGKLWYHSGGGITFQSSCEKEYNEVIDKIYVPVC